MKKKITLIICVLIIIVFGVNRYYMRSDFNVWYGKYTYQECYPTSQNAPSYPIIPCIEYSVCIFEENDKVYAEIINQGYQTNTHALGNVIGDNRKIDIIFEKYLEDNVFEIYNNGDILFSFEVNNNKIYTTWNIMQTEFSALNKSETGIYFEKE